MPWFRGVYICIVTVEVGVYICIVTVVEVGVYICIVTVEVGVYFLVLNFYNFFSPVDNIIIDQLVVPPKTSSHVL